LKLKSIKNFKKYAKFWVFEFIVLKPRAELDYLKVRTFHVLRKTASSVRKGITSVLDSPDVHWPIVQYKVQNELPLVVPQSPK
jgi:hypothetical protein